MTPAPHLQHTSPQPHVHRRDDWRPCPALLPPPLTPRKPAAVFMFAFADAVTHGETLEAFVETHPDQFPALTSAAPFEGAVR